MKLCMFHPNAQPMERGWVGRIDGDRVSHLAAQTLQSFFLGGGGAREHAEYALDEVTLLVPVLYPPSVRIFDGQAAFEFANPAAVGSPGAVITAPDGIEALTLEPRLAAVIGADGAIGGYSLYLDWRAPRLAAPKDRDFGSVLGPIVATPDELDGVALDVTVRVDGEERLRDSVGGLDWESARLLAGEGTLLRPGDVLVSPSPGEIGPIGVGSTVEVETPAIGVLSSAVSA
jgi:2-keto-4-pentenoate hydratase/2-oxohepta-3-ene-1,7-dioic acid hydratase in catechol pathway